MTSKADKQLQKFKTARQKQRDRLAEAQTRVAALDVEIEAAKEALPDADNVDVAVENLSKLEQEQQSKAAFQVPVKNRIKELDAQIAVLEYDQAKAEANAKFAAAVEKLKEVEPLIASIDQCADQVFMLVDDTGQAGALLSRDPNSNAYHSYKGSVRRVRDAALELRQAARLLKTGEIPYGVR